MRRALWVAGMVSLFTTVAGLTAAGCSDDGGGAAPASGGSAGADSSTGGASGGGPLLDGDCDPLVPTYCGFPFPSNVWLTSDATTPTGKRVALGAASLPTGLGGVATSTEAFNQADGFSASAALLVHLPGASVTGLATPLDIARSLTDDSPTLIVDAETGERVPHFSELDVTAGSDDDRAFMIRPVVRLKDGHRYLVAIRNVVDGAGTTLPVSPAFAALRDGTESDEASVGLRRALYADIFSKLSAAGVEQSSLQLAWDFTTASLENNTGRLLHMRDQALADVGADGPSYVLDDVKTDVNANVAVRVEGRMTVPLFLDKASTGGVLQLDAAGKPAKNGSAEFPFVMLVPKSATSQNPATVMWYGHGLLGDRYEADSFDDLANLFNYAIIATDWSGMASDDVQNIVGIITGGDIGKFGSVADRLQQGILNALLATRMAGGGLAKDDALEVNGQGVISSTEKVYFGGSQGGIFGATYMAVSTDVTRGVLAVPGQPYNLLLQRSVNFDQFFALMKITYPSALDIQMALSLAQMLWDRAEPSGYSHTIEHDPLPNTPSHAVLLLVSIGDHQVSTLGGHVMARAVGAKNLLPVNRSLYGIDEVASPHQGSALVEFDFGLPPEPITNEPMRIGQDPHSRIREVPAAGVMLDGFLRTGKAQMSCSGACDPD